MNKIIILFIVILLPTIVFAYQPIAHYDVVPYQRIDYGTTFNFGVVAFSKPGISSVSFAIASGTATYTGSTPKTSSSMALNTRAVSDEYSGVWEYFIQIPSSDFSSDGTFTVTATVTDNNSNTRVLDAWPMYVEATGADVNRYECWVDPVGSDGTGTVGDSEDPFPSISTAISACATANGGESGGNIIYLEEYATYDAGDISGTTTNEWLTIQAASGTTRANVIFDSGLEGSINKLHFKGITLQSSGSADYVVRWDNGQFFWTDDCWLKGSGKNVSNSMAVDLNEQTNLSGIDGHYSTDCYVSDATYGYKYSKLVRGAVIANIHEDALINVRCAINVKVDNVFNGDSSSCIDGDPAESGATSSHSDVIQQYYGNAGYQPVSNTLHYGIFATDAHYQGVQRSSVLGGSQDNAFINVFVEMRDDGSNGNASEPYNCRLSSGAIFVSNEDHLLVWNCSFPYGEMLGGSLSSISNSSFIGNLFRLFNRFDVDYTYPATVDMEYNHFMYCISCGESCEKDSSYLFNDFDCPRPHDIRIGNNYTTGDGVVDISDDTASNFGYPIAGSSLVNALPSVYVPVDALGNARDSSPDIGALELVNSAKVSGVSCVGVTIQ